MTTNRMLTATAGLVAGLVMVPMAMAWACTSLATIDIKPGAAVTGAEVTGKGYGFAGNKQVSAQALSPSPVEIHFQRADGPLLAKVLPDRDGNVSFRFTAPAGAPNYYTIIATQTKSDGTPVAGTPARTTLALNNPPPLAADGATAATTTDVHGFGVAPDGVTHIQAPAARAANAPAANAPANAPAQVLPPIQPAGARARDILSSSGRSSSTGGQLGLTMVVLGALAMTGAAGTALFVRRSQAGQGI